MEAETPISWNRYLYCRNDPINMIDPDGRTERSGWRAGFVRNNSKTNSVYIAGDIEGKGVQVRVLKPGEASTKYFKDTDAVIFTEDTPIDGHTSGAYKLGTQDIDIEDKSNGELRLDLDNIELITNKLKGTCGVKTPEEAKKEGWVVPETTDDENIPENSTGAAVVQEKEPSNPGK